MKKIKDQLDENNYNYALKNSYTLDKGLFLKSHNLSFIEKGKEIKKLEYFIWISNSQCLRAINAKHYFIGGNFDICSKGFSIVSIDDK